MSGDQPPNEGLTQQIVEAPRSRIEDRRGLGLRDWIDVIFKVFITAAAAYGTYYLSLQKQSFEEIHTQEVQQNDDIRLIVEMVAGDAVHRSMALAISKAYAGNRVPMDIYDSVRAYVTATSPLAQITQDNSVAEQVKTSSAVTAAEQAAAASLPIRVYIQYERGDDRAAIEAIRQNLNRQTAGEKTIISPPIELVSTTVPAPVLKCFRDTECNTLGNTLVEILKQSGAPSNLTLQPTRGYENSRAIRPYHFEAWFGPLK